VVYAVRPVPPRVVASVPVVSARATLMVEVATHEGRPVVKSSWRILPEVEVARAVRFAVPPLVPPVTSAPSAIEVRPVPPLPTVTVPKVMAPPPVKTSNEVQERGAVQLSEEVATDWSAPVPAP
jgi:hypothetical protein